jgi:Flp pilus assembly protein TadG
VAPPIKGKRSDESQRRRPQSGSVLVEFALMLLPTFGFLFLLLTLTWVVFAWACVQEAVREGTRAAITCTPSTGLTAAVQAVVQRYSVGFVTTANTPTVLNVVYYDQVTLQPITGSIVSGDVVKVTVSGLEVSQFASIMHPYTPLYITAASADIMACDSPATP